MQSAKDCILNTLFTALKQCWTVPSYQNDIRLYDSDFISIVRIPFLATSLDNAESLFVLVISPGFHLYHVEVADRDPASGILFADYKLIWITGLQLMMNYIM